MSYPTTGTLEALAPAVRALASRKLIPLHCGAPLIDKIRDEVVDRGGLYGFRSLDAIFKRMDANNDKVLSKVELKNGLQELGLDYTTQEMDTVMRHFDRNADCRVSTREFIDGLTCKLDDHRRSLVYDTYALVNKVTEGAPTIEALAALFDAASHPEVQAGLKSEPVARAEMASAWGKPETHVVTKDEFMQYWRDVSVAVGDEDWFELMIRNPWHLSGGKGVSQNTSCRRVLCVHADGRQTLEVVKNDLGVGAFDAELMLDRLKSQGIITARSVQPLKA